MMMVSYFDRPILGGVGKYWLPNVSRPRSGCISTGFSTPGRHISDLSPTTPLTPGRLIQWNGSAAMVHVSVGEMGVRTPIAMFLVEGPVKVSVPVFVGAVTEFLSAVLVAALVDTLEYRYWLQKRAGG